MVTLQETFAADESRVYRVLLFVDMNDSTQMKEATDEASWLTRYGWFYDEVKVIVEARAGRIVKYTGDGAFAVFTEDHAADAINAAVALQESLDDNHRRVELSCSVGIATGEVIEFQDPQGHTDYVGVVVDRAARLCASASPKAVWVDRETINTALMRKVQSRIGVALRRSVDDYQGEAQKIWLKGLGPVEYHEIVWAQAAFGVRSTAVTADVEGRAKLATPRAAAPSAASDRLSGSLIHWNAEKNIGIVEGEDGRQHFVGDRYLVGQVPPTGTQVWFTSLPARREGENPVAACVVAHGQRLVGYVSKLVGGQRFGFVEVEDDHGNTAEVFWYHGDALTVEVDDEVSFVVGKNAHGPVCEQVEAVLAETG